MTDAVEPTSSPVGAAGRATRVTLVMAGTAANLASGSERVAVFPALLYAIAAHIGLDTRELTAPKGAKYGKGKNAVNTFER